MSEVNPEMILKSIADQIQALKLHPATSDEYDAGYIGGRNDALAIVQEVIDCLTAEPEDSIILSAEEQKAQGTRCSCNGADDYCQCQNIPDAETRRLRFGLAAKERATLSEKGDE